MSDKLTAATERGGSTSSLLRRFSCCCCCCLCAAADDDSQMKPSCFSLAIISVHLLFLATGTSRVWQPKRVGGPKSVCSPCTHGLLYSPLNGIKNEILYHGWIQIAVRGRATAAIGTAAATFTKNRDFDLHNLAHDELARQLRRAQLGQPGKKAPSKPQNHNNNNNNFCSGKSSRAAAERLPPKLMRSAGHYFEAAH